MRNSLLALAACLCAGAGPFEVETAPVAVTVTGAVEVLGAVAVRSGDGRFGGLSGLDVAPGGERFTAITDQGFWVTGRLIRTGGRLVDVAVSAIAFLPGPDGAKQAPVRLDSEGLTHAPGGGYLVSFERIPRIAFYARPDAPAEERALPAWEALTRNGGLEALASDGAGRVLAIAEDAAGGAHPAWLMAGETVTPLSLPAVEDLSPTDAVFGPDGALWLLSRRFSWLGGFFITLDRLTLGPDGFSPRQRIAEIRPDAGADNFEGLDIWRDASGRLRLTLVSDDNFNLFQKTIFLELALTGQVE